MNDVAEKSTTAQRSLGVARARSTAARVVWVFCLVVALVLATAAFTFALDANDKNGLVRLLRDLADFFDLGVFDLQNPVKDWDGENGRVKTALFNYGLAAVVYLVVGRLLERLIRP